MTVPYFLSTGQSTYTFTRRSGSYINGRWSDGAASTFTVKCNIQPNVTGSMTRLLPEGDRSKKSIVILTQGIANEVRTSKEGSGLLKGDEVSWEGDVYEVREIFKYSLGVLDSYQGIAVRKEVG